MKNWHVNQRMLKLRVGSIAKWKTLAARLELPVDRVVTAMLDLHLELTLARRTWLSAQELAKRLAPGAAAQLAALGLAENRTGQVVLLDVERTVNESLMRHDNGVKRLPAVRARDLAGKMRELYANARGPELEERDDDQRVLELLRARAKDSEILERWKRAVLSNGFPRVQSFADLNRTWAAHAP